MEEHRIFEEDIIEGPRWAIDSLLICGRTDGQAGGGEREALSLGVFVLVVVLRKMTTKNSSVLFFFLLQDRK